MSTKLWCGAAVWPLTSIARWYNNRRIESIRLKNTSQAPFSQSATKTPQKRQKTCKCGFVDCTKVSAKCLLESSALFRCVALAAHEKKETQRNVVAWLTILGIKFAWRNKAPPTRKRRTAQSNSFATVAVPAVLLARGSVRWAFVDRSKSKIDLCICSFSRMMRNY